MAIIVEPTDPGAESEAVTLAFLGESGIVLGATDEEGCRWHWDGEDPWSPSPAARGITGERENTSGSWDATEHYVARRPVFKGIVRAPNHDVLHRAKQRLFDAVAVSPWRLRIIEPGYDRTAWVRRDGEVLWSEGRKRRGALFSISLLAPDPLVYSTSTRTYDSGFPTATGGLVRPATWPATRSGVVASGSVTLVNDGSLPAPLRARVTGPCDDVTLAQPETGKVLTIANPNGPTLRAGEWLDIDTARRQVLLLGTGGRRSWARGDWLMVPPGESDLLVGTSGAVDPAAGVVIENDDVWI
jgi:hypothetical protein